MKIGSRMEWLKKHLNDTSADVYMVENCGMENERVCHSVEEFGDKAGYYSIVIVKDKNGIENKNER